MPASTDVTELQQQIAVHARVDRILQRLLQTKIAIDAANTGLQQVSHGRCGEWTASICALASVWSCFVLCSSRPVFYSLVVRLSVLRRSRFAPLLVRVTRSSRRTRCIRTCSRGATSVGGTTCDRRRREPETQACETSAGGRVAVDRYCGVAGQVRADASCCDGSPSSAPGRSGRCRCAGRSRRRAHSGGRSLLRFSSHTRSTTVPASLGTTDLALRRGSIGAATAAAARVRCEPMARG
jgi:hypothetical protein